MSSIASYISQLAGKVFGALGSGIGGIVNSFQGASQPTATPIPSPHPTLTPVQKLPDSAVMGKWIDGNPNSPNAGMFAPTPTPSPVPAMPTATPPTNGPAIPYQVQTGQNQYVPSSIAQVLMNIFDPIHAATESASVLAHPWSQTIPPWEQSQIQAAGGKVWNNGFSGGENRGFKTDTSVDIPNPNGSIDRGLFRINSDTFNGWINNPRSQPILNQLGITNWDDMLDPQKNATFAKLLMEATPTASGTGRSWRKWWAAPLNLRHPSMFDAQGNIKAGEENG